MLKELVVRASGKPPHAGLNLGRDAKKNLEDVKALGDKSAHNRRFIAHAPDLMSASNAFRFTARVSTRSLLSSARFQLRE